MKRHRDTAVKWPCIGGNWRTLSIAVPAAAAAAHLPASSYHRFAHKKQINIRLKTTIKANNKLPDPA
jgi:hypothetical protein